MRIHSIIDGGDIIFSYARTFLSDIYSCMFLYSYHVLSSTNCNRPNCGLYVEFIRVYNVAIRLTVLASM